MHFESWGREKEKEENQPTFYDICCEGYIPKLREKRKSSYTTSRMIGLHDHENGG
jgi:hypothetical protein